MTTQDVERTGRDAALLSGWIVAGVVLTVLPLLLWGGASVFALATACNVPEGIAWVPAVSTGGVMLAATLISLQRGVDEAVRWYAAGLAGLGILGDIVAAGAQHYLEAQNVHPHPSPVWGFVVGGLPSLMGGLLIHVVAMIFAQRRREQAQTRDAMAELSNAEAVRVAVLAELEETARLQREAQDAAEAAATRSRVAVQQELGQAAALRAEVEAENEALEQARRENERLRSRKRRAQRSPTALQPGLGAPLQQGRPPASRDERRQWVRNERAQGNSPSGADVDRHFGPPRTGYLIVREIDAEIEAELRVVAGGQ